MIIGDGIVLGAGGETASIFVTGLSETDTITATNGSDTKIGVWTTKDSVSGFLIDKIKEYSTWTVVATNITDTISETVLVDSASEYSIEMRYPQYLYRDGNYYTEITGGFYSNTSWWNTTNRGTATKNANNSITIACPNNYYFICYTTRNKIDVSNFSTLNLNVLSASWFGTGYRGMYLVSNPNDDSTSVVERVNFDATGIHTMNVSNITGSYYVALYGNSQDSGACSMAFDKLWLE